MLHGEEERDDVHCVIRMEVRKEDAVHRERIEVRPEHPADRPGAEVEDQRLSSCAHHDTALASPEARDYRTGPYDRDLDGPLPSVELSISACLLPDVL